MRDINLWLITNKPDIAKFAISHGVDKIFVDLELIGKLERQGHLDTVISHHTINDVKEVRNIIPKGRLLVRSNPIHPKIREEINRIIDSGADIVMLPMWKTMQDIEVFLNCIAGRTKVCLLAETPESLILLPSLCKIKEIDEFHIGLNDLRLALNKKFMFETLADGLIEKATQCLRDDNKTFGIGGLARIGEGLVPPEIILGEHVRLGSSAAILSRTFHRNAQSLDILKKEVDLPKEINMLKGVYRNFQKKSLKELDENRILFRKLVKSVVQSDER